MISDINKNQKLKHLIENENKEQSESKNKIKKVRNNNLANLSTKIKPETALFTMIKLIIEHQNQINIKDSVLSINSDDLDFIQKLNYCRNFLFIYLFHSDMIGYKPKFC